MTDILTRGAYAKPGSSLAFKTGTWRTQRPIHVHAAAPCHLACPAGEDAQAYIAALDEGNPRLAWERIVAANPMPATTGRVCPHPCESSCNRGHFDEPIAIHAIERWLGDEAIRLGWAYPVGPVPFDAPEIAIVGAGPAGLSAAYHLLSLGLKPVVFDALPQAGGILGTALPAYRLPRDGLNAEIERILACGIRFEPRTALGRHVSLQELQDSYSAVFLAPGAQLGREWSVDGVVPDDLHQGLDLLKKWNDVGTAPCPRSAAVVGAGNTAVDVARVLRRVGVPEVHLISHKAIPRPGVPPQDAMPAIAREVEEAMEEGVIIHEHRGLRRIILRGAKVAGVEMVHMKKLEGTDGRLHRVAFEGTETVLHVDQVFPAVGQAVEPAGLEAVLTGRQEIRIGADQIVPGYEGLFAGGDAAGDGGTVSAAVGAGRRAALAIAAYVRGETLTPMAAGRPIGFERINTHYYERGPGVREPVLPVAERTGDIEIVGGLTRNQVEAEARRCFSCGNCLACDNCWTYCPDQAVLKTQDVASDGSNYIFDYDYCKGCGLCASECPCGFIEMIEEP